MFFFTCSAVHPDLHSFPTRRSSDLGADAPAAVAELAPDMVDVNADQGGAGCVVRADDFADDAIARDPDAGTFRSEEHTSELQSQSNLVCRLLLEKKKKNKIRIHLYN